MKKHYFGAYAGLPRAVYFLFAARLVNSMQVQEELVRRRVVHKSPSGRKRTYSCNHCFAQIIVCGECRELYRRVHWNNHGCKSIVWRCISRLEPTAADMSGGISRTKHPKPKGDVSRRSSKNFHPVKQGFSW